jgi:hypothetical protein
MTVSLPIDGGCYCGRIRYRISRMPRATGICHCRSCRRTAGAQSVAWAVNETDAFAFTTGRPHAFRSSDGVERTFCGECGTTLTYRRDSRDLVDVTLATLDDPELLPPTKETWCRDRVSWNQLDESLAHHEQGSTPPG